MGDVSAQSQADMVRKELGHLVGVVERRQKQSRKFSYDVVHDAHARSELQIGDPRGVGVVRDRIQSLSRQMKVHGVKRVVEIEPWALAQVMKHDAARMERLGLYRPTVQPKFAGIFSVYLYDDHIGVVARRRVGHGVKRHVELATGRRQGVLLNSLDECSVLVGQPQYMLHPPVEDVSLCHDKLSVNYLAFVKLASIRIWLRPRPNLNIPRNRLE
jgi:hypothetical protein